MILPLTTKTDAPLPQNIEAEEAVLGALLSDPKSADRVADLLTPEAFFTEQHRKIFEACLAARAKGQLDLISVAAELADRGWLSQVGGRSSLVQIMERCISSVNADLHARLVMEKYQRRTAIEKMSLSLETACDPSVPMARFLEVASKNLESIYCADGGGDDGFQSMEDCLAEVASSITRAIDGEKSGVPTGVYDLDELLVGGLHPSDMVIVAARPSMGKTAFALHCAATIAKTGLPVGFFSLEMSGAQLALRLLAAESGIESVKLRMGAISDSEVASLTEAMTSLQSLPLYICDSPNPSVEQMRIKTKTLMAHHGGKLGAIFIDYLQLMDGKGDNRVLELSKITRSLKQLARELQVPVVVLSQLSRGVESRNDKRPGLSDLRDSGSIEQDADVVVFLYREEYYSPETETERGITEAIVRKHRNGPIGTVKMLFDAGRSRFRNATRWE